MTAYHPCSSTPHSLCEISNKDGQRYLAPERKLGRVAHRQSLQVSELRHWPRFRADPPEHQFEVPTRQEIVNCIAGHIHPYAFAQVILLNPIR